MPDAAQSSNGGEHASDLELFEQYLEQGMDLEQPDRGDLRKGVIVEIRPTELLVNIGSKRDGVVPQSDLSRLDPEFVKALHEGEEVDVMVSRQADDDGIFQLSIADALQQRDWIVAQELLDGGQITVHKVVGYNKGGLTVEFSRLRGFVPASHVLDMPRNMNEEQRETEFQRRIGEEMRLKVIEVDRKRRRLVMSQMLAEREHRAERKDELFRTLQVGDVIAGEVRSLRPFGAFVNLGGADGLLHVSEIGWAPISHPREALEVGQKIEVQVIRLDPENQRIGLSRKRVLANPWESVEQRYTVGAVMPATITRLADFGAFAQLEPGVEGLIHISELADITVAEPLKTVRPGDKVMVKVLRVDPKRQRIGLSLRQAAGQAPDQVPDHALDQSPDSMSALAPDQALDQAPDDALEQALGQTPDQALDEAPQEAASPAAPPEEG
jgi:small subunit ribosomal protein S1